MKKRWISPFESLIACYDEKADMVELVEDHARGTCQGGASWASYHLPRTSFLVLGSRREGARTYYTIRPGKNEVELDPAVAPVGIEECTINGDEIHITYTGLGGAGVGITGGRSRAPGVKDFEVFEEGGGAKAGRARITLPLHHKVYVGIDDTDSDTEGATWALANEIGYALGKAGPAHYLSHTIVQLFPGAPGTTRNCAATCLGFAVEPEEKMGLIGSIKDDLASSTLSVETGMAVLEGVQTPRNLRSLTMKAKKEVVDLEEVKAIARQNGVDPIEVTGERGIIGACAALGLGDDPGEAVKL